jgi:hypothetical protein
MLSSTDIRAQNRNHPRARAEKNPKQRRARNFTFSNKKKDGAGAKHGKEASLHSARGVNFTEDWQI